MTPLITEHNGTGRMIGFLDDPSYVPGFGISEGVTRGFECDLGGYRLCVKFNKPVEKGKVPAAGLIITLPDEEYVVAGSGFTLRFVPKNHEKPNVEILTLDEGSLRMERGSEAAA